MFEISPLLRPTPCIIPGLWEAKDKTITSRLWYHQKPTLSVLNDFVPRQFKRDWHPSIPPNWSAENLQDLRRRAQRWGRSALPKECISTQERDRRSGLFLVVILQLRLEGVVHLQANIASCLEFVRLAVLAVNSDAIRVHSPLPVIGVLIGRVRFATEKEGYRHGRNPEG